MIEYQQICRDRRKFEREELENEGRWLPRSLIFEATS